MRNSYLLMKQVEGELEPDGPHVCPLEGARHVHVHLEEPLHGAAHLARLLDLQLRQQVDEPLERALVAVDPKEVDLKRNNEWIENAKPLCRVFLQTPNLSQIIWHLNFPA